jgi:hypothetical protein
MVLSTGGAGLAVSGFASQTGNASQAEYGTVTATPTETTEGGVLGEDESGGPAGGTENNNGGPAGSPAGGSTQPTRQVESGAQGNGGGQLPFTGFAAIPILLGGVALLVTGLVMRRRTADDS